MEDKPQPPLADLNKSKTVSPPVPQPTHKASKEEKNIASATADNYFETITCEVAKYQKERLTDYYYSVSKEKRKGVNIALVIAFVGFLFFGVSVGLLWAQWNRATNDKDKIINFVTNNAVVNSNAAVANANTASVNAAITSVICGALLEFVALAIFYFYGRGFNDLQDHLDINQRFLLANIICEGMDRESRQKAQAKIVEALFEHGLENQAQQDSEKVTETGAASNNPLVSQSSEKIKRGN
jgi:hypothetical protein